MAKPIKATPVIKGKDATRIIHEMNKGTPSTPKRVQTMHRADAVYAKASRTSSTKHLAGR